MKHVYASFWVRFVARIIDIIIVSIFSFLWALVLVFDERIFFDQNLFEIRAQGAFYLIYFIFYQPILDATGGTVGKRILGYTTISKSTNLLPRIFDSYLRSFVAFFLYLGLLLPHVFSCLAIFGSKNRQTWHDCVSNVVVVKKSSMNNALIEVESQL